MRSNELAELAGVTVRTLRHYHQIGLLDEPERSANGYRRYTVRHLATVLRIARFTDLGLPLLDVRDVINDSAAAVEVLDRLDEQAVSDIERLAKRRHTIAQLKNGGAAPDLPLALIPYAALTRSRPRDEVFEREQLALIQHFSGEAGLQWLVETFANLSESESGYAPLIAEFAELQEDSPRDRTDDLVDKIVKLISTVVPLHDVPLLGSDATALLLRHQDDHFNATQRLVWTRVLEGLASPEQGRPG